MIFSYNWLQSFFQKKLPKPEKLAELLTMHSFEVEKVEKKGKDSLLDIDVLPNRGPDCFSHIGIARECGAITESRLKIPKPKLKEDKKIKAKDYIKIEVESKEDCFRYSSRIITDVKIGSSPKWIQERLKICGLRPINNIVDITNYVMLETGQPLHAFDFEKIDTTMLRSMTAKRIIVRRAKKGEKIITLDDEKYNLDEDILIIADEKEPLAIAGIKGGKKAEIDKKTKTVVLESANFNQELIRKGSRKIDLKTDASWRFEHRIDPNLTETAINRAAELIQEIAGGRVAQGLIDFYPQKVWPKKIKLNLNYIERLLGIKISLKEIKNILQKLEFKVVEVRYSQKIPQIMVEVPTFRLDISLEEDLIEEVGRIYGYDKIRAQFPLSVLIPPSRNLDIFWENKTKDILKEIGFCEVYNYSFISDKDKSWFQEKKLIEVKNPLSSDFKYLRPHLLTNLLKNIENNFKYLSGDKLDISEIKIFELGKIFLLPNTEKRMLAGAVASKAGNEEIFFYLKGVVEQILQGLGISDIWYDSQEPYSFEALKPFVWDLDESAEIKIGDKKIGFLGRISKDIIKDWKIKGDVFAFYLDFEDLVKTASEETEYRPISPYPASVRDLAVLVPLETKAVDVLNIINAAGGKLVKDVDLFDIYEGEELPEGKKNFAFHIIYQASDRTLKSEEIDRLQKKIISALEENVQWEVRKK